MSVDAVCHRCGAEKDLALARCGACGYAPSGADRELAVLASRAVLDAAALAEVQARVRAGEALRPSGALRERARAVLGGRVDPPLTLSPRALTWLFLANVLVGPLVGWGAWWTWSRRPGPAARQALVVTVPVSIAFTVLWWGISR